jgi:UDP:flavonoid glycosyltransferase YjiC (YdhE family)
MEGADLVLAFSVVGGAPTIAESLRVPYRYVALFPPILPSSQYPPVFLKNHNLPPWINRVSWWFTRKLFNLVFKAIINHERRHLGLTPIAGTWSHLLGDRVIVASDSVLGPVPPDVEFDYKQVGYFHLKPVGELEASLKAFLESRSPPVYVGFGSMPERPKETTKLVLEATRDAGQRLILSKGWAHLGDGETEKNCYIVDNVPHPLLFPYVSAVVHHGGAGTTATAARAGVPQIIVPHLADQYYWGKQIERLGLGPKPISRSRLTVRRLAAAIRECLSNEMYHRRAKEVARILQAQNSISKAVTIIESEFLDKNTSTLKNIKAKL